jgi:hypothetical protein
MSMSQPPQPPASPEPAESPSDRPPPPREDAELAQALDEASSRKPGPSRLTLGLSAGVLLVGGFFGGLYVGSQGEDAPTAAQRVGFPDGFTPSGPDGAQPGESPRGLGDFTTGTVTDVSDGSVTVETPDGDEVTVKTDDDTDVTLSEEGSVADLAAGDTVAVTGNREDDGSITADSIAEGNNQFTISPGAPPADS